MPCYKVWIGDSQAWLCGDLGEPCYCGSVTEALCDYPVGDGRTCDRMLCGECGTEVAPDLHYCRAHYQEWQAFRAAGGVERELSNVVPFRGV